MFFFSFSLLDKKTNRQTDRHMDRRTDGQTFWLKLWLKMKAKTGKFVDIFGKFFSKECFLTNLFFFFNKCDIFQRYKNFSQT